MTASTAPITLPAQHRAAAPTWWVHTAIAYLIAAVVFGGASAVYLVATIRYRYTARQQAGLLFAIAVALISIPAFFAGLPLITL